MRALLFVFASLFLAAAPAYAAVYKWVDEKGVVHYTDQPPAENAKPAKLPPLQTYKGSTKPKLESLVKPENGVRQPVAAATALKISSPAPEETFRGDAQGQVPVSVQITPGLGDAQFLVYRLDGADQSGPIPSTSFVLTRVERGAHTVSVTLVNSAGQELARSESITVHMKPPIIKR